MSVQFAGSRSMDDRRRRRLAVNGEGTEASDPGEEKFLPDCVPAELCAASPWIPLARWKLWSITVLLLAGLTAVLHMTYQTPTFRPELEPALAPLFQGDDPKLIGYLETMFWTLAGQLAILVGWHRSRSRLDFRGRYWVWPWAAAAMFFCGLCAATKLHLGLGKVVDQIPAFEPVRPRLGWVVPGLCLMLPLGFLMDRDVRRSTASVILLRFSFLMLTIGAGLMMYCPAWIDRSMLPMALRACGLFGSALLMLAMWTQGWFVAYVTPDPPVRTPWRWPSMRWNPLRWILSLLAGLFKRREVVAEPAPKRRRKSEEGTTTKRKRKPKRTTRRSRPKVVEEEVEEEAAEDEDYEEAADESTEESEEQEDEPEASEEQELSEEDEEELTRPSTAPAPAYARQRSSHSNQQEYSSRSQQQTADEMDEEEDDQDGKQWRVDGPSPDQLKGLSKKQRRALIKQHRDQQRNQR